MDLKRYIFIVLILLVCMVSISAVSAVDDATSDIIGADDEELILDEAIDDDVSSANDINENDEIVSDSVDANSALGESSETGISSNDEEDVLGATKSFKDLYNSIYANGEFTTVELTLNDDYAYSSGDSGYIWHGGINIKKKVTIHGNGHTINCNNQAIAFTLTNKEGHYGDLTIYDLKIINGQEQEPQTHTGGAIIVSADTKLTAQNCNFTNCKALAGGAIMSAGSAGITLTNCVFSANKATYASYDDYNGAGAIYGVADYLTITNCVFKDNYAPTEGGALLLANTPTTIKGTNFTGNYVNSEENLGAAIYAEDCTAITIENSNFIGNKVMGAQGEGAAICGMDINTLTITGSNFINNNATSNGAVISTIRGNMNIRDSTFKDNNAGGQGGAIWIFNVTTSISNSNFTSNTASGTTGGGAIYSGGPRTITITGSRFTSNKAKNSNKGGALYLVSATLNITGSSFGDNSAAIHGGAIYQDGGSSSITNSNFTNNVASSYGGAILITGLSSETITGSNFKNNVASENGGAIFSTNSPITVKTSTFDGNHASSNGGVIYTNANLDITGSNFSNNYVDASSSKGGAIYATGSSTFNIKTSTFKTNNAVLGGAIYATSCANVKIENSDMSNNNATQAGAIYSASSGLTINHSNVTSNKASAAIIIFINNNANKNLNVNDVTFSQNNGGQYGSIYVHDACTATIDSSRFNNGVAVYGGAIYGQGGANIIVKTSNFTGQTAAYGGAIYTNGSTATVTGSSFTANTAALGGGIYIIESSTLSLTGSTFTNNVANVSDNGRGGGIYSSQSTATINGCLFSGNSALEYGGGIFAQTNNNINVYSSNFTTNKVYGKNSTTGYGGGICLVSAGDFNVNGCRFADNFANYVAAAIFSQNTNLNVGNSVFDNNDHNRYGVYATGTQINSSVFSGTTVAGGISMSADCRNMTVSSFTISNIPNGLCEDTITITVTEAHGFSGNVNVTIGSLKFTVTLTNGQGSKQVPLNLGPGTYKAIIDFHETGDYYSSYAESNEFTLKIPSAFTISPISNTLVGDKINIVIQESHGYTGAVNIKIGSKSFDVSLSNGQGRISINPGLPGGTYRVILEFPGNNNYSSAYAESNQFNLQYLTTIQIASVSNGTLGETISITVTETHGYSFVVNVTIGSKTYPLTLNNGNGILQVSDLGVGTYKAIIDFPGTKNLTETYAESNQFSIKYPTTFTIANIANALYGEAVTIQVTEANGYSGNVNVKIGAKTYQVTLNNGNGAKTVSDIAVGTYKAIIDFQGTNDYNSAHAESNEFNIKYQPAFTIATIPNTIYGDAIAIDVTEAHGLNGTVTVTIGSFEDTIELINGRGSKNISPNLDIGTYKAILSFSGSDKFVSGSGESNEFAIKTPSFVDLYNLINGATTSPIILEHDYVFDPVYDSEYANGIRINRNVEIDGNGHIIDGAGLARIFDISAGATVAFENIELINAFANEAGGAINAGAGTTLEISNVSFENNVAPDGAAIYSLGDLNVEDSTFMNNPAEEGSGIRAEHGTIRNSEFIGGDTVSGNIDTEGCIFLTEPAFTIATISNTYVGSPITISVTEAHGLNGTVTVMIDSFNCTINLVNGSGKLSVSPNLVPGTYKAILDFVGFGNFTSATASSNDFTVSLKPTAISASAVKATYNVKKNLVATLKDNSGKAISGVKVTIKLNGKTYTKTTDKNGQVKLAVSGLVPKSYTATITFAGNAKYAKSTKSVKVTVKKATPKMTAKAKTFKVKVKTKKFTITLKNNAGKVMKKTKVTLKVNKKTFSAKTNAKGIATFKITNLKKKGTFTAVIKYAGNKYYNKVTKKAKIAVKK